MQKRHRPMSGRKTTQIFAKYIRTIYIILLLLLYAAPACAFTPTVTPAPVISSSPVPRSIVDSYDVQLFENGKWRLLGKEMIAVHEEHRYYDGLLMFMPLSEFVNQTEIPRFRLTADFNYHVVALDPNMSLEYSHTIYNDNLEKILYSENPVSEWNRFDTGKYLVSINVSAANGERYAHTASLFWLIVGDCDDKESTLISTPTAFPSPSPAPSVNDWYWDFGNSEPADDDDKETFMYSILEDGTYSLINYAGKKTHVEIPEQVNGHCVTEIGSGAFHSNSYVTTIILPDTIKRIGEGAFGCCTALKTIHLPDSLTSIGESAFFACEALESIDLPSRISFIEKETFALCSELSKVTLPSALHSIGERAFASCYALRSIELPEGLYSIGTEAFSYVSLRNVVLPRSLQSIEDHAFHPSFNSLLVYSDSCGEVYAQRNGIPYNAIGENLAEKYSWLPSEKHLDTEIPTFYVYTLKENRAFFALWDPLLKESYVVNQEDDDVFDCMWKINFQDQISGERLNVMLLHANQQFDTTPFLKPQEMVGSLYYPETDDLWDIALHLPVQRYKQWLIWDVAVPSAINHKPDRKIDFSFFNVSEYEIAINISRDSRYEQYTFAADECIITAETNGQNGSS